MKRDTIGLIAKWAAGFGISLAIIWAVTAVFTENYYPEVWSPELEMNVPAAGWSFDRKTEGWARTTFGELGIAGIPDVRKIEEPKVIVWGDSFVEAFQVDDDKKMDAVLTRLLKADGGPPLHAVAVGHRFRCIADWVLLMPRYEDVIGDVRANIIFLHTLQDLYPDRNPRHRISLFLSKPEFHFERYDNEFREIEPPLRSNRLKNLVYRARLQFFLRTKKQITGFVRPGGLHFALGHQKLPEKMEEGGIRDWNDQLRPDWAERPPAFDAWNFVLDELEKASAGRPVLFVYAPAAPGLDHGKVIETNAEGKLAEAFAALCEKRGFGFVSLQDDVLDYWHQNGRFVKGFHNSRPWEGHYNSEGHRLTAEAMHRWIRQNTDVIYPD